MPPPETITAAPLTPPETVTWLEHHPVTIIWAAAFCLWVSLALIIRMWMVHRKASLGKKLRWSIILLVPVLGWLYYTACFHPLDTINTQCPTEHDWGDGSASGGGFDSGAHH